MPPKAKVQKRLYYKIGDACKALNIQPYVLRYWETEFPALSPNKSRSGQRVYSAKELAIIRRIKELLYDEGYTIAGAKKKLETELAGGGPPDAEGLPGPEGEPEIGEDEVEQAAVPEASAGEEIAAPPRAAPPRAPRAVRAPAPERPQDADLQQPLLLDTRAVERVESMRTGIQLAIEEARGILALLARSPSSR
jgi:DNA-binding transcriptional MerR regulator